MTQTKRRRRKIRKKPEHLRAHAIRRALERYGPEAVDLDEMKRQILAQEARFVYRESHTRTHWVVRLADQDIPVVYNTRLHEVVTVLPPEVMSRVPYRPPEGT